LAMLLRRNGRLQMQPVAAPSGDPELDLTRSSNR